MSIFNDRAMKERRRELRRNQTAAEKLLWTYLRGRRLGGWKFKRQFSVGAFVIDFYCCAARLAVELDGSTHELAEAKENDAEKEKYLKALNIRVLRFSNDEVLSSCDTVINRLLEFLNRCRAE